METTTIITGFLIWYLIGASGFYYWWTKDYDLGIKQLPILIACGFIGVGSWIIGFSLHSEIEIKNITIFKKRTK